MGGRLGPDQVGTELRARQGQQGPDGDKGTGGKMVGLGHWGWGGGTGVGHLTRDGVPDKGWGSRHEDGVPDMGWDSRHGDGVPDKGWGSRQGMWCQTQVGFQIWDDGVPDR